MPIRAIAYASEAVEHLLLDHIDDLARDSASFNLQAGVTGVLLFDGSRFLQYIEGPEDSINIVHSRILGASSHREVVELARGRMPERRFPYWSMRLLPAEPTELRAVAHADWRNLPRCGAISVLAAVVLPHVGSTAADVQGLSPDN